MFQVPENVRERSQRSDYSVVLARYRHVTTNLRYFFTLSFPLVLGNLFCGVSWRRGEKTRQRSCTYRRACCTHHMASSSPQLNPFTADLIMQGCCRAIASRNHLSSWHQVKPILCSSLHAQIGISLKIFFTGYLDLAYHHHGRKRCRNVDMYSQPRSEEPPQKRFRGQLLAR